MLQIVVMVAWAFVVLRKMEVADEEDCDLLSELFVMQTLTLLLIKLLLFLTVQGVGLMLEAMVVVVLMLK